MSFESDITHAFEIFQDQTQAYTVRIANEAHASVVELSPVDTGFFRTEWQYYPQEYPVINIRNDTEYGPALENGSSQQAPYGMVRVTVNMLEDKYGR
jgi:hypothetical protein